LKLWCEATPASQRRQSLVKPSSFCFTVPCGKPKVWTPTAS
jgi:hypothetical protein